MENGFSPFSLLSLPRSPEHPDPNSNLSLLSFVSSLSSSSDCSYLSNNTDSTIDIFSSEKFLKTPSPFNEIKLESQKPDPSAVIMKKPSLLVQTTLFNPKLKCKRKKANEFKSSKYKGVCWNKNNKKWQAQVYLSKKLLLKDKDQKVSKYKYLGLYHSEIAAAEAYDMAALQIYKGKTMKLNFPSKTYQVRS